MSFSEYGKDDEVTTFRLKEVLFSNLTSSFILANANF